MNPHGLIQVCSLHQNLKNLQPALWTCFKGRKRWIWWFSSLSHKRMRDTKRWEAGKAFFSPLQPPPPPGGLCSQQEHPGLSGLAEAGSGGRSDLGLFTSLSAVPHYFTAHFTSWTIISIAKYFPFSSYLLHWEPDGSFSYPKEGCAPLGSNGYFSVFKASWGIKISQKWFPQEWKAVRKLHVYWDDDQIPKILLSFLSVKFLLTGTRVYFIRTVDILFRTHDSGQNWNRCLSISHGNNGALLL